MPKSHKIISLSILVIALSVVTVFISSPKTKTVTSTTSPTTADWKIYTGKNISIFYPSNWNLTVLSDKTEKSDHLLVVNDQDTPPKHSEILVDGPLQGPYGINKDYQTQVVDYVNYYLSSDSDLGNYKPEIISLKDITIGDLTGKVYTITISDPEYAGDGKPSFYSTRWIFIPDKDNTSRFYNIRLNGNDSLLDQILSTFRFLDPPKPSAQEDRFLDQPTPYQ